MPIYEYKCQSCGQHIEVMQRMSDDPLTTCESCGGELKKQISAPAFQFKGSGWYVTDYARKGEGGQESKGDASEGSSDSGSSEKSSTDSSTKSDSGSSSKTESTSKSA